MTLEPACGVRPNVQPQHSWYARLGPGVLNWALPHNEPKYAKLGCAWAMHSPSRARVLDQASLGSPSTRSDHASPSRAGAKD